MEHVEGASESLREGAAETTSKKRRGAKRGKDAFLQAQEWREGR